MEGIIAIIPARGGSKGIIRKNIKPLNGKPLISYTITAAKQSKHIGRVIVSTEDTEIKEVSLNCGAEVIDRPTDLAQDNSPTLPVLQHTVQTLKDNNEKVKLIVLLQSTAQFQNTEEIDEAIEKVLNGNWDSLISLSPVPKHFNPIWQKEINDNGQVLNVSNSEPINDDKKSTRRQDLKQTYWKNGQIYIMTPETLMKQNSLFGERCTSYIINRDIVNIDTEEDWKQAEKLEK
jgi:CMP-N-acetylneuraminic acid synthetase|tara:strand:+ start:5362 stop:6060 length:699 start_codon:yes stop_codon:yes gene_type:complete